MTSSSDIVVPERLLSRSVPNTLSESDSSQCDVGIDLRTVSFLCAVLGWMCLPLAMDTFRIPSLAWNPLAHH
ncbi:hypothetical protein AAFF_G00287490 [Aldrovandia affinis]|uniref:Uncharacterized protein n=1 Tax=Aldrovandia affinis TaxID=143900 RepID=A0AAD7SRV0_9TELE|nr:hypothetical protein AAFF_G00287490 [Aldrovandia affinis]